MRMLLTHGARSVLRAAKVADGLGMELPAPLPLALDTPVTPEVDTSPALSLMARTGDGGIRSRKIALLVADGVDGASLAALQAALLDAGAVPRMVAAKLGTEPRLLEPTQ